MKKEDLRKRIKLIRLAGLTPDNVAEIFNKNFNRWRYYNSSEVIVNDRKTEGLERFFMMLPDRNGNPNINSCTVSDTTKEGFPLTEEKFIEIELHKFEPLYNETIGSSRDIETSLKLKTYIDYLKNKISPPLHAETKTDKLKVPQIALIHIYEGIPITEQNATEIAAKYTYTAKTSGKGLYHDYLKYYKTSDRKAKPTAETKKTLINKIDLFKSVLPFLTDKGKAMATDEISILETILEKEYQ